MPTDKLTNLPQVKNQQHRSEIPGEGPEEVVARLSQKLPTQPTVSALGRHQADLALFTQQTGWADSYQNIYGTQVAKVETVTLEERAYSSIKAKPVPEKAVKIAGPSLQADSSKDKKAKLKKRKINANRFRARTNKPGL